MNGSVIADMPVAMYTYKDISQTPEEKMTNFGHNAVFPYIIHTVHNSIITTNCQLHDSYLPVGIISTTAEENGRCAQESNSFLKIYG